jgi:hypothetical protein
VFAPRQQHHLEGIDQQYYDNRHGNKHPKPGHIRSSASAVDQRLCRFTIAGIGSLQRHGTYCDVAFSVITMGD